jgi:hypothetical protein
MNIFRISTLFAALLSTAPVMAQSYTPAHYYSTPWGPVFTSRNECEDAGAIPDMKTLDLNRDGIVSEQEWQRSGLPDSMLTMFSSIDKDGKGYITEKQLDAYRHVGRCEMSPGL